MRRMSACRQLLIGMSIRRYFPPIGTAGLDRWWVSGNKRDPWPPPRMSASASLFTGIRLPTAYTTRLTCNTAVTRRRERSATILRSMNFRLIPREEKFYTDFQALADELKRGARLLEEMLAPERPAWDKADEIKEAEHKCDQLTHEIIQRLNRTFVTPLARRRNGRHRRGRRTRPPVPPRFRSRRGSRARAHRHRLHRSGAPGRRR